MTRPDYRTLQKSACTLFCKALGTRYNARPKRTQQTMSEDAQKPTEPIAEIPDEIPVTQGDQEPAAEQTPEPETTPLDPLEAALAEATKWKDVAARSQAELDNYRKRMAREKSDAIKYANANHN